MFVFGTIGTAYYQWKKNIEHEALLEFNQKQMEKNIKDQQEFSKKQQEIAQQQQEASAMLIQQNAQLTSKIKSIDGYLSSDAAKKGDRPSSDVIKKTIDMIQQGNVK
jgi:hypothetical protein